MKIEFKTRAQPKRPIGLRVSSEDYLLLSKIAKAKKMSIAAVAEVFVRAAVEDYTNPAGK